jgi:hypothetical protein
LHHTSFVDGQPVKAAGEWHVVRGKLQWLSGASGHYHTTGANLQVAIRVLETQGIKAKSYKIKFWRRDKNNEKVEDFLRADKYLACGPSDLAKFENFPPS